MAVGNYFPTEEGRLPKINPDLPCFSCENFQSTLEACGGDFEATTSLLAFGENRCTQAKLELVKATHEEPVLVNCGLAARMALENMEANNA